MKWQAQDTETHLSDLLRAAETSGPQVVTRDGRPVAVVLDIDTYRALTGAGVDFGPFLRNGPSVDAP